MMLIYVWRKHRYTACIPGARVRATYYMRNAYSRKTGLVGSRA